MLISVIIPTHNDAEYLRESLPSVLQQDYSGDMEIIVVDDGSEPPAEDLVPPEDSRVRFIRRLPGGVSAARNTGIDSAKGDILFFLDADDLMLPGRIRRQIQAFELDPDIGLVGGDITRRDL
ncbi:glycosyltransferase family 2 protein, partial [bacterium]|nr:glycosyltransferase family 2 protein [bacterium]